MGIRHKRVSKRQRPQVLGGKQIAQIGLPILGIKGRMNLRHNGVNTVSSNAVLVPLQQKSVGDING